MSDAADATKKKESFFAGVKKEFKKIVWPDKVTVAKESAAVVVVSVILGAVIALVDWAIKLGLVGILGR
ncbi:MAG: preprotein translocase subunit SecE [Lachnospiraceae bacterium]|jgi:preprotein translocase subunit SecE|nr:preprotein translocase subunit SecE [Lachnospiraceae bacterium]MBR4816600.1 preprotein translocase subunit SecE [Lachnospiraceae bacterium]MCR4624694.1 preprotein translocase subunit SecE [Lachnospiraceae bacterium]